MMKKLYPYAQWIIPGAILLVAILMFLEGAATFHYTYVSTTVSFPGSGWDFLFGYSAEGRQIVQANIVGIFMLMLMVIAAVIPLFKERVQHRFFWSGFLLVVAAIFMFVHPFLSIISAYYQDRIDTLSQVPLSVSVTYSLGIPLILSGILLFVDGVFAFVVSKDEKSFLRYRNGLRSNSQKRPNPKSGQARKK